MKKQLLLLACAGPIFLYSCMNKLEKDTYQVIVEDQDNIAEKAQAARDKLPLKLPQVLK